MTSVRGCCGPDSKPPSSLTWEKSPILHSASPGMTFWSYEYKTLTEPLGRLSCFGASQAMGKWSQL